ncbi:hypothetical protein BN1708_011139 [Verticillium longisporum]|uniref:Uncharacterized protein n=1 Tax=Verticillium longisporum TaxID=100787 RepID=A0A0G4KYI1_VERLO|nr:hypothetical protein BN1708_011139 [Verticillium longisporum]
MRQWTKIAEFRLADRSPFQRPPLRTVCLNTYQPILLNMPFFYNKSVGGRRFGTSIQADRHGVRRGPWRFRIGRFNCFK